MHKPLSPSLPTPLIRSAVTAALAEDLGRAGDITTLSTIGPDARATAVMNAREAGVIAGMPLAAEAFAQVGEGLVFAPLVSDGDRVEAGQDIARITGPARALLSGERVALNYLMHLSGIATHTARFVDRIAGTGARICCTRKTTPGLRAVEKYAVRCGGGANHRFGLDDAILIKDNHIAVCGGIATALERARAYAGHLVAVEIEVDTLDQLQEALDAGADAVLLDNMAPETLREAVAMTAGRARLEASGGVNFDSVRAIAETGVDYISTSRITMAAGTLDIGLDIRIEE
ncbi:nicotinate-nucleotide pyrophosphorylase (carboxylating) [Rubricella aquisinus]|uniref:Probable nicotinate-nucleotide pyrophosphorylase [carboxylating] n=1 Tax=Rubricella aquisinus TaxID=2028108 RepID=A0A840WPT9_9RHOB|nr:carboxylating nicotinate-nucleotide diphosphorylase [Rubricella aquisinus]MBB5516691.1 nicotinate-nucleotide pyrophosphorylase (carboxylating) [Rubricella aquisinus]